MSEMTPEQQAEAEKAQKAADKAAAKQKAEAEKAEKAAARAAAKAQKEADKAAAKAEKEAAKLSKVDVKAAAKQAREDAKAAKLAEKERIKAEREATRQPEQNGVRRPGPNGLCGRVWGLADAMSAEMKQAVPIANLLERGTANGLNASNIRTEYARWKKFHGLSGRITAPVAPAAQ